MPQLIDVETPQSARTRKGFDGYDYEIVFSDEFNTPGRTFYPGSLLLCFSSAHFSCVVCLFFPRFYDIDVSVFLFPEFTVPAFVIFGLYLLLRITCGNSYLLRFYILCSFWLRLSCGLLGLFPLVFLSQVSFLFRFMKAAR